MHFCPLYTITYIQQCDILRFEWRFSFWKWKWFLNRNWERERERCVHDFWMLRKGSNSKIVGGWKWGMRKKMGENEMRMRERERSKNGKTNERWWWWWLKKWTILVSFFIISLLSFLSPSAILFLPPIFLLLFLYPYTEEWIFERYYIHNTKISLSLDHQVSDPSLPHFFNCKKMCIEKSSLPLSISLSLDSFYSVLERWL